MSLAVNSYAYRGPERRHNRIFVTLNSEYHCRDRLCVAVSSRRTGELETEHPAVGRWLSGSVRFDVDGLSATSPPEVPRVGEQLCFTSGKRGDPHDVVTSTVVRIERPPKEVGASYPMPVAPRS
jgi:hypothetical protein